jgi:predicted DNA-binding transcriptional regulator AlpA
MATTTAEDTAEIPAPEAGAGLLIDIDQLSVLLRRSVASLERDQAAGRLPAQVYVGGSKRWRRAEIVAWVASGCPPRARWEEIRTAGGV